MCKFCVDYGEGMVWYKNPKNYARRMYRDLRKETKEKGPPPELAARQLEAEALMVRSEDPQKYPEIRKRVIDAIGQAHAGQVITLQEAEDMLNIATPLALIGCFCRRVVRGKVEEKEEFTCMGLGVGMFKWDRWPERYKGGVVFVSPEEGKEWLEKWDERGYVHTIMSFGTPYVGGICNCDYSTCLAIRYRLDYGWDTVCLKGHYVAKVEPDLCNGCGRCLGRCQFGALTKEVLPNKAYIDMAKCFGCALCANVCPTGAITLVERSTLPGLADVW